MDQTFTVEVAGVKRALPLVKVPSGVRIAVLDSLGDTELVVAAAKALAVRLPRTVEALVTAETKGIPLVHQLSFETGLPYVVLRKEHKPYMGECLSVETESVGSGRKQTLHLGQDKVKFLSDKRVAVVDDVISTGSTIEALSLVARRCGAEVVATVCIFTEGDQEKWSDVISLGHLPLF